jgi:hypothetical protein
MGIVLFGLTGKPTPLYSLFLELGGTWFFYSAGNPHLAPTWKGELTWNLREKTELTFLGQRTIYDTVFGDYFLFTQGGIKGKYPLTRVIVLSGGYLTWWNLYKSNNPRLDRFQEGFFTLHWEPLTLPRFTGKLGYDYTRRDSDENPYSFAGHLFTLGFSYTL